MKALSLIFTVWLALFVTQVTVAQFPSNNGKFTVDAQKGCANLPVRVTHSVCGDPAVSCSFQKTLNGTVVETGEFDNANTGIDVVQFPTAGTYILSIIVGTTGVDNDEIRIDVSPNTPPVIESYSCDGGNVFVKVVSSTYPAYIFDYADGTPTVTKLATDPTDIHTYIPAPPTATQRTVKVTGSNGTGANDASCVAQTSVVTVANILPVADIRRVEVLEPGTSIKVDFTTDPSIEYRFEVATNNLGYQRYATLNSSQTTSITQTFSSALAANFYCFRVNTYNPCTKVEVGSSPIVCSLNLTATAQSNQNDLTWAMRAVGAANPLNDITITKNEGALSPNVVPTPAAYTDRDVTCKELYTYRLTGNYPGGAQSLSRPKSVTAFSNTTPPQIKDISAQVDGTNVTLTWPDVTAPASFSIVKTVSSVPEAAQQFTTLPFVDPAYSTQAPTCYRVTYTDLCGNTSPPSPDACPVQLTGSLRPDNTIDLTWSDYSGWTSAISTYLVSLYNEDGNLLATTDAGNVTTFTDPNNDPDNQICTYVITARATDGTLDPSVSNTITLIKAPNLYYPTGFTPNRDGTNDTFRVFGQRYVVSFDMKVFNRWGEMMYNTNDKDDAGWDGTYKGNLQPEGTYVFTATVIDRAGRTFEKSGAFYLLRKK